MAVIGVAGSAVGAAAGVLSRFVPLLPQACAFCASSSTSNKAAYIGTTLLLLALPASFLSALIVWLIRRSR